jgi:hypothetical protein
LASSNARSIADAMRDAAITNRGPKRMAAFDAIAMPMSGEASFA